ncbi:hypothetical protein NC315_13600 [Streptomyces sp. G2]|uniref:hypothetical protein n=1 Tax=Streptomyces sp. G2 TaxID=1684471 RepID=UPI00202F9925|nr:hypothetical protein [Streptomyces sp. G2]MCM1946405.1 hypothetical protein [Streptomyces sp. G2]
MIVVQVRRLGVVLVAALALAGCASPTESALADAQQACENFGYGSDGSWTGGEDAPTVGDWDAAKWKEVAAELTDTVNIAARAAREDRSWDSLSNAFTDFQKLTVYRGTIENLSMPQADRDAAQAQYDALNPPGVVRTMEQECRKALAD